MGSPAGAAFDVAPRDPVAARVMVASTTLLKALPVEVSLVSSWELTQFLVHFHIEV